jgi:hypothetical protein
MSSNQDSKNPFRGQAPSMRTRSPIAQSEASILQIDDATCDTLASIVWVELFRVLAHHDPMERQEHHPHEWDSESKKYLTLSTVEQSTSMFMAAC